LSLAGQSQLCGPTDNQPVLVSGGALLGAIWAHLGQALGGNERPNVGPAHRLSLAPSWSSHLFDTKIVTRWPRQTCTSSGLGCRQSARGSLSAGRASVPLEPKLTKLAPKLRPTEASLCCPLGALAMALHFRSVFARGTSCGGPRLAEDCLCGCLSVFELPKYRQLSAGPSSASWSVKTVKPRQRLCVGWWRACGWLGAPQAAGPSEWEAKCDCRRNDVNFYPISALRSGPNSLLNYTRPAGSPQAAQSSALAGGPGGRGPSLGPTMCGAGKRLWPAPSSS